ncbi:PepSY domain-containing protein [Brevibacillus fluminis]|nr:PepSY domain-containing protein [Brevibacillus fluminis]
MKKRNAFALMLTGAVALNILGASGVFAAEFDTANPYAHKQVEASEHTTQAQPIQLASTHTQVKWQNQLNEHSQTATIGHVVAAPAKAATVLPLDKIKTIALQQHKGFVKSAARQIENGADITAVQIVGEDGKLYVVKIDSRSGKINKQEQSHQLSYLPLEQIKHVALQKHKGFVKTSDFQRENGVEIYVIQVVGEDGNVYTEKIDPRTGKITKSEAVQKVGYQPIEKIKMIALKQHKGYVQSSEFRHENGIDLYNIRIHGEDGIDHEVKLDAKTGAVCK